MKYFLFLSSLLAGHLLSAQSQPFGMSLYFDKAEFDISVTNRLKLDEMLLLVKDSTYNSVFIKGFADKDGTDEYNLELSEKRVASVQSWFYNGKYNVKTKCYGEQEAINKNRTEGEKSINRRVDVIFWTNYEWGKDKKKAQVFKFPANRTIEFTAAEGTKIKIPVNSLAYANGDSPTGEIQIEITEFYKMSDILQNKLTTTSNGEILISAGMINIEASRNGKELSLKPGTAMEIGFADRSKNDGFGVYYGNEGPSDEIINWVPAVDTRIKDENWYYSGVKLFVSDTIEKWRSKLEFNNLGQRIRVTEKWVEGKGTNYDTIIVEKTINKNNIILQATKLGWINCDQLYNIEPTQTELIVDLDKSIDPNIVLIFSNRKAMIQPTRNAMGQLVFVGVPAGEKVVITGVGSDEGKLYFTKKEFTANNEPVHLDFVESTIQMINEGLSGYN